MEEQTVAQVKHDVPKCTCCGNVGPWKVEPVLRGIDWVIGIALMILGFVPGIVYLVVVFALRSKEDKRAKICPKCKAKNMFTSL